MCLDLFKALSASDTFYIIENPAVIVLKTAGFDFSFWNKENRAYYKRLIEKAGGTPELVYMKASKGTLQKRLYKRNQSLNANSPFIITNEILEHHYNDFQEPCGEGEKVILQE